MFDSVNIEFLNRISQPLVFFRRQLRGDDRVHIVTGFHLILHPNINVSVRISSLLILDGVTPRRHFTEDVVLRDIFYHRVEFQSEHSGNDVWSLPGRLPRQQHLVNLRPLRVGRHRDEKIRFAKLLHHSHRFVKRFVHKPRSTNQCGRYDDRSFVGVVFRSFVRHRVLAAFERGVLRSFQLFLLRFDPLQLLILSHHELFHEPALIHHARVLHQRNLIRTVEEMIGSIRGARNALAVVTPFVV